jgi:hypothetical protein
MLGRSKVKTIFFQYYVNQNQMFLLPMESQFAIIVPFAQWIQILEMSAATTRITSTIGTATNPVPITLDDDLLSLADVRRLIAAVVFLYMDMHIRDGKTTSRNPKSQHIEIWDKRCKLSWKEVTSLCLWSSEFFRALKITILIINFSFVFKSFTEIIQSVSVNCTEPTLSNSTFFSIPLRISSWVIPLKNLVLVSPNHKLCPNFTQYNWLWPIWS